MNEIYSLAYELLNGQKKLRETTSDECVSLMETFYKESVEEYRDIIEEAKEAPEVYLAVLQNGVKLALKRAGDNDGYYEYASNREKQ